MKRLRADMEWGRWRRHCDLGLAYYWSDDLSIGGSCDSGLGWTMVDWNHGKGNCGVGEGNCTSFQSFPLVCVLPEEPVGWSYPLQDYDWTPLIQNPSQSAGYSSIAKPLPDLIEWVPDRPHRWNKGLVWRHPYPRKQDRAGKGAAPLPTIQSSLWRTWC